MAELSLGNNYDINKTAMLTEEMLDADGLIAARDELNRFIKAQVSYNGEKYFMLLCHEERSYTVFNLLNKNSTMTCAEEVLDCAHSYGEIISVDLTDNADAFEIWIKESNPKITNEGIEIEEEAFCYFFFPYSAAVIEVK